ncbi:hypothetical protein P9Y11_23190 [Bacillus cereus]|nr:hypothetical protein [Bacillus cereus]
MSDKTADSSETFQIRSGCVLFVRNTIGLERGLRNGIKQLA